MRYKSAVNGSDFTKASETRPLMPTYPVKSLLTGFGKTTTSELVIPPSVAVFLYEIMPLSVAKYTLPLLSIAISLTVLDNNGLFSVVKCKYSVSPLLEM